MMMRVKKFLYKHGFRPQPGSIFYSVSLAVIYGWNDAVDEMEQ